MKLHALAVILGLLIGNTIAAPIDEITKRTAPELILPDAGLDTSKDRRTAPELILPDAGLDTSKDRRTAPEVILPDAGIDTSS